MTFRLLLLVLGFTSITLSSHGQQIYRTGLTGDNFDSASRGELRAVAFNTDFVRRITKDGSIEENVEGSRYFNESFLFSKIFYKDQPFKEVFSARYNAFEDIIELDKGAHHEALLKDENVTCAIGGVLYLYQNYIPKKGKATKLGYLKLLYKDSNKKLLVREHVRFKEAKPAKTSMTASFPAKFVQKQTYYYQNQSMEAAILITKKTVLSIFPDIHKDDIKSYIKTNKLDLNDKNDLIKLFKYNSSM